jgi:hypothetical protein
LKFVLLAAALLLPTLAMAQAPAPEDAPAPAPAAAPKPAMRAAKPAPKHVAAVAKPAEDLSALNVAQIDGIRQVDPATYEIDARLADGHAVNLRMNAFVMQDLGRRLGTFGK